MGFQLQRFSDSADISSRFIVVVISSYDFS